MRDPNQCLPSTYQSIDAQLEGKRNQHLPALANQAENNQLTYNFY